MTQTAPLTRALRARRLAVVGLSLTAALALAACGSGEAADPEPETTPAVAQPAGPRPTITAGEGQPPTTLVTKDLVEGDGPTAEPGDLVAVQYVGGLWSDGTEFDASWDRGQPFTFQLGAGQVIQGWEEGVAGMRVGGRRELVIPPDLAYGATGQGAIPPDATLIFVVDLVGWAPAPDGATPEQ